MGPRELLPVFRTFRVGRDEDGLQLESAVVSVPRRVLTVGYRPERFAQPVIRVGERLFGREGRRLTIEGAELIHGLLIFRNRFLGSLEHPADVAELEMGKRYFLPERPRA